MFVKRAPFLWESFVKRALQYKRPYTSTPPHASGKRRRSRTKLRRWRRKACVGKRPYTSTTPCTREGEEKNFGRSRTKFIHNNK